MSQKHLRLRFNVLQKLVSVDKFVKITPSQYFRGYKLRRNTFNSGDGTAADTQLHLAAQKHNTNPGYCASSDFHRHKMDESSLLESRCLTIVILKISFF